jgi:hypothetical protein
MSKNSIVDLTPKEVSITHGGNPPVSFIQQIVEFAACNGAVIVFLGVTRFFVRRYCINNHRA